MLRKAVLKQTAFLDSILSIHWQRSRLINIIFAVFLSLLFVTKALAKEDATYSEVLTQLSVPITQKHPYGKAPDQFYLRWQQQKEAPLVIFIHGGCWLDRYDIEHAKPFMSALFEAGFTVIGIEYRRTKNDRAGWPIAKDDLIQALRYAVQETSFASHRPIAVLGHSAGGHLALLAATQSSQWAPSHKLNVHGLAAIVDVATYAKGANSCQKATSLFMGGLPNALPEAYKNASPLSYQMPSNVEVILWHGAKDNIVSIKQASYPNALVNTVQHAGHFSWIHTQTTAYKTLLLDLLERAL